MWLEKSLGNCWGTSHSVQSREHRLWKHEPIWPLELSTVNSWALKHGARLCMPYWCYKTGSRLAVAWSISNSFTVPSVACSQMTFGWQKLGLQSWQSGMQPTVFWQTHNWPSDHQPTFCTQVTGGAGLLIGPYSSSWSSSQYLSRKQYRDNLNTPTHILQFAKRTWYVRHKLLKFSFKLSWQPKVNKRKAHLWWTLIQREGMNILNCFNTRLCISCNSVQWLGNFA